jgi:hypothetical protein
MPEKDDRRNICFNSPTTYTLRFGGGEGVSHSLPPHQTTAFLGGTTRTITITNQYITSFSARRARKQQSPASQSPLAPEVLNPVTTP